MALIILRCEACGEEILTQQHTNGCFRRVDDTEIARNESGELTPWALCHAEDGGTLVVSREGN